MQREYFNVRFHRENFEYYAGHSMRKDYESPEEFLPLSKADFGFFFPSAATSLMIRAM